MSKHRSEVMSMISEGRIRPPAGIIITYKAEEDGATFSAYGLSENGSQSILASAVSLPKTGYDGNSRYGYKSLKIPFSASVPLAVYYEIDNPEKIKQITSADYLFKTTFPMTETTLVSDTITETEAKDKYGTLSKLDSKPIYLIQQGRELIVSHLVVTFKTDRNSFDAIASDPDGYPAIRVWGTAANNENDANPIPLIGNTYMNASRGPHYQVMCPDDGDITALSPGAIYSISIPINYSPCEYLYYSIINVHRISILSADLVFRTNVEVPDQSWIIGTSVAKVDGSDVDVNVFNLSGMDTVVASKTITLTDSNGDDITKTSVTSAPSAGEVQLALADGVLTLTFYPGEIPVSGKYTIKLPSGTIKKSDNTVSCDTTSFVVDFGEA